MKWQFFVLSTFIFSFIASAAEIPLDAAAAAASLPVKEDTSIDNEVHVEIQQKVEAVEAEKEEDEDEDEAEEAEEQQQQIPVQVINESNDVVRSGTNHSLLRLCPHHEVFLSCPDAHTCQTTCATLNHACVITPDCTPGCFCKEGYARDANDICVPISDCPGANCPRNEEFIVCNDNWKCQKTCAGRYAECPETAFCSGGCQCRPGYFRDTTALCVKSKNCVAAATTPKCPHKEIWRTCSRDCAFECNVDQAVCEASGACSAGCYCVDGFVKIDGRCVAKEKCPATV